MKRNEGTIVRVGVGNADVRIGATLHHGVPVAGLDYAQLQAGDRVAVKWLGEKPSVQSLLDYKETAGGIPAGVAAAATQGDTVIVESRIDTLQLVDKDGGIADPDSNSQILMQAGAGISPTAAGNRVLFSHATGDIGDVHTNYTEHDQQEAVTDVWNFAAKLLVSDSNTLTSTSPWAVLEVKSDDTTHVRLSYDQDNYAELTAASDGTLVLTPSGTAAQVASQLIVDDELGVSTATPRRHLDVLDAVAPQVRLTHTDNSVYTDLKTTEDGYFLIEPSGGRMQLDLDLEFIGAQNITTSLDDLTIAPAGDLLLNPGGAQIKVNDGDTLQAESFASQTTGWGISGAGSADFRYIYTDELHAKAFITDIEQALAGGQIISKSVAVVAADFTVPAAGGTQTLWVEDLPGAPDRAVFQAGDMIRLRQFSRDAGSLSITDCWGVVTNYTDGTDANEGTQSWTFTRSTGARAGAATGGSTIAARSLALDYGTSGNGFYEVNAIDGLWAANSPYFQVVTWATHPYDGKTVRLRGGNLKGVTAEEEYGLFSGNGLTTTSRYLRLSDQHTELHNLPLTFHDGTNTRIKLEPLVSSGGPYISVGNTAPSSYLGGDGFWVGNDSGIYKAFLGDADGERMQWDGDEFGIYAATGDPLFITGPDGNWMSSLMVSESLGQWIFSQNNGLALWGPNGAMTTTGWTSTRGQQAAITGAFHQVQGRWAGTRALMVETACTNYILNPSAGVDVTSYWTLYNGNWVRSTTYYKFDGASFQIASDGTSAGPYIYRANAIASPAQGARYTFSAWVMGTSTTAGSTVTINITETGGASANATTTGSFTLKAYEWARIYVTATVAEADRTGLNVWIRMHNNTSGRTFFIDGIQLEAGGMTSNCIGSMDWCSWGAGTPHQSAVSTRLGTELNLDAYANLLNGRSQLSIRIVAQMPHGSDATCWQNTTYNWILGARLDSNNTLSLWYNPIQQKFYAQINADAPRLTSDTATFAAGDWLDFVLTLDFTADEYKLYIDGIQSGATCTDAISPPAGMTDWQVGASYAGTQQAGVAIAEYGTLGAVLTADQVAAMYATRRPLVDAGSTSAPGIYILDGKFAIASSTSGTRLEMNSTRLAIGDGVTYGSGAGVWLGLDSGTPKFWIASAASGARIQIDTASGIAGYTSAAQGFALQPDGDAFFGSDISAAATTALSIFANAQTYNSESMGAGDVLLGDNSAAKANVLWDKSAGTLLFRGGTTTQAYINTDGSLVAGAGAVALGSTGLIFNSATTASSTCVWKNGATIYSTIYTMHDATPTYHLLNIYVPSIAGLDSRIWVDSFAPSGKIANIAIRASCDGGSTGAKLILQDDGTSRSATLYSAGKLTLSVTGSNYINLGGPISTNSGTNKWQFFGYTAGAPTVEGYVTVVINGATYRLAAEAI